ncbi:MULE domain-containing protein [Trichonephila clavipes]|nr:MULE domain-containing protein [Trichonephila clavipes]
MTDDSEPFFNAWKTVFGIHEKIQFCTWHVDRSWRRSISRLITKKEIEVEAYKMVRSLLVETDEAAFDIMLKEALKMFDEKDEMKELKRYFEQTYSKVSSKISQLRKRYKDGQSLTSLCIQNNEKEWSVSSIRGKDIYMVQRKLTCSKECPFMCRECNHYLHNFTCTCIDKAVQWNMCKHIHFICSKNFIEINSTILEERPSLDSRITDEEMIICEDWKVLEKEAHVDNLRATSTRTEISKEEFQKECMQFINKASPEQYNILTLLRNTVDSLHLFPEANQEIVSRTLNMAAK